MGDKLVVFGGGGFVGGNLCTIALRQGWDVAIADATFRQGVPGARWHQVDITDGAAVRALLRELSPDAVVDLAAVADIDRAEREQELAWAVNAGAAEVIASASAAGGAYCLYFSSDAVFPGTAASYAEDDPPGPLNFYGRTKVEGEKAVLAAGGGAGVVRISLALGFPVTGGNSFFAALASRLEAGEAVTAPREEIRTPVDVLTLAECVLEMVRMRLPGILHIGSTDSIDRAALTSRAAELMGFPGARILAQAPAAQGMPIAAPGAAARDAGGAPGARAARHKNGIISVAKARRLLKTPLLSAEQSIQRAIKERL